MKKLTLPRLASAVLGALFFLAACIVLAVRLVRGEAGLTDAAALVLTAAGGAALTVLALRSRAPGLRRSLWVDSPHSCEEHQISQPGSDPCM